MMSFALKHASLLYESGNKPDLGPVLPEKPLNKTWPDTDSIERFIIVSEDDVKPQKEAGHEEQKESEEIKEEIKQNDYKHKEIKFFAEFFCT